MNKKDFLKNKDIAHEGIKNIELTLENCEVITIPREKIGHIYIADFKEVFGRCATNWIDLTKFAETVIIQIQDALQDYYTNFYGIKFSDDEPKKLIDRLSCNDITSITVNYLWDDEQYSWSVSYEEDEKTGENRLQTTREYLGDIWIAIGEKAQQILEQILPESEDERDFQWLMYDMTEEDEDEQKK